MGDVKIRIAGANGDGIESTGALLIKLGARSGLHVFGYRGYQSIIRGGHVWYQIRMSDTAIESYGDGIDVLVAITQDCVTNQAEHLNDGAVVIYDPRSVKVDTLGTKYRLLPVPLLELAVQVSGGEPILRNIVGIGVILKLLGMRLEDFEPVLRSQFGRKGDAVVENNMKAASLGFNYQGLTGMFELKGDGKRRRVLDGNTALAIGAYAAGCKLYAGYPMTPASSILQWFAAHENVGVLAKQTEDELTAINTAIGGSVAGVRSMCGTSGGGFSLMVEALGFAGMIEAPLVVVLSQRTGPSTGLPTKTEQADLLFAMHASQGEFPRIVLAPRSVDECFYMAAEAFNLADRYQCPVIIMLDLFMSEHMESVGDLDLSRIVVDRGKMVESTSGAQLENGRFKRYAYTEDGISPRAMPGTVGLEHIAPSDEHNEFGDLVSDALSGIGPHIVTRVKMHGKRMRKLETMLATEKVFAPSVDNPGAKYFLVCWGSSTLAVREAAKALNAAGGSFGVISFSHLMPLSREAVEAELRGRKLIDVECNYTAQLAQVIMMNSGIEIKERILKYDGEALTPRDVVVGALAAAARLG